MPQVVGLSVVIAFYYSVSVVHLMLHAKCIYFIGTQPVSRAMNDTHTSWTSFSVRPNADAFMSALGKSPVSMCLLKYIKADLFYVRSSSFVTNPNWMSVKYFGVYAGFPCTQQKSRIMPWVGNRLIMWLNVYHADCTIWLTRFLIVF